MTVAATKTVLIPYDSLSAAMAQAEAATRDGQPPIVVIHEQGRCYRDGLVVMRLDDFLSWFSADTRMAADGGR